MRTSLGDQLHALGRPAALAALAAVAGGAVGLLAPTLGLWSLAAQVRALETADDTTVTTLTGATTSPEVWVAVAAGVVVVVVGLLVALDRPPAWSETVLLLCALVLAGVATVAALRPPSVERFAQDPHAAELLDGRVALPEGVGIVLDVQPASGLWLLGAGAVLVAAGSLAATRYG